MGLQEEAALAAEKEEVAEEVLQALKNTLSYIRLKPVHSTSGPNPSRDNVKKDLYGSVPEGGGGGDKAIKDVLLVPPAGSDFCWQVQLSLNCDLELNLLNLGGSSLVMIPL